MLKVSLLKALHPLRKPKACNFPKQKIRKFSSTRDLDTITTIDCSYMDIPNHTAAYLLKEGNSAVFIDNNTNHSVPILLETLEKNRLTVDQVKYIIITHIHLDHAGGLYYIKKDVVSISLAV